MVIVMFALFTHRFGGIGKLRKIPKFDLQDECHCRRIGKLEFSQSTRNIRIHTGDFLRILAILQHTT